MALPIGESADHLAALHRGLHDRGSSIPSRPTRCWRSAPAAATRRRSSAGWSARSTRSRSSRRWGSGRPRPCKRLHYTNVHCKVGDGYQGWPEHAPFDKIIVTCSPEEVPAKLVEQLKEGGRMIIPVGQRYQQTLYLLKKADGKLVSERAAADAVRAHDRHGGEPAARSSPTRPSRRCDNGDFEETIGDPPQPAGWHYLRQLEMVTGDDALRASSTSRSTTRSRAAAPRPCRASPSTAARSRPWTSRSRSRAATSAPASRRFNCRCWESSSSTRAARCSARGRSAPGAAPLIGKPRRSGSRCPARPARPSCGWACSGRSAICQSTTCKSRRSGSTAAGRLWTACLENRDSRKEHTPLVGIIYNLRKP